MGNLKYITSAFGLLMLFSCQKLDREIVTTINRQQVDASYEIKAKEVLALYNDLADGLFHIDGEAMLASASDEAEHTDQRNAVQNFNTGSWNAINNPDNAWSRYYRAIRKANQFIASTDNVDLDVFKNSQSESQKAIYRSRMADIKRWSNEAKFLRAFYYFELIKRYGGVPIITESLPLTTDFSKIPRNTLNECVQFIEEECNAAALELPPTPSPGLETYDVNDIRRRATKFTALALKSRLLLYAASDLFNKPSEWASGYAYPELISMKGVDQETRWAKAADAAKEAIDVLKANASKGGADALHTSYRELFIQNNSTRAENIFIIRGEQNNTFEKLNNPIGLPLGRGLTTPSQDLVDAYEVKVDANTSVKFDWNNPAHKANPYATSGATARDPRLFLNVVVNNGTFGVPVKTIETYEGGLNGLPLANATRTGYYLKKYQQDLDLNKDEKGVHSWVIFRLAELYLNYAEAKNELNDFETAKTYVNLIRDRSGVKMPLISSTGLTKDIMREKIRNEKRVEFAFEDHRLWDLRRWMEATKYLDGMLRGIKIVKNGPTSFTYTPAEVEKRAFVSKMYLYPIPTAELSTAKGLVQNPGW